MTWFLDTNICIYLLKGKSPELHDTLLLKKPDDIKIPSMVQAELYIGAAENERSKSIKKAIDDFLSPFEIIPFDTYAAIRYAQIRTQLTRSEYKVGPNDLIIAATVLSRAGILVTNNQKEYSRIRELSTENWS